ncbi:MULTISPECIES: hypothetical protein [Eisenbergiella]|uniref:Glycoside hydrolase n=1 Tax=Eisenbergiella porci TaxID=2652274 RepID=A0A6N7W2N7_9FIRM|nr:MULTISPECIES: hypothetical protein [Eisenbergiella]MSS89516.1 hypothetical protein [Eisenbergiella porci]
MKLAQRQKLFQKPSREFRGKPFWSWNGKLEEKELKRQIDIMKEMGFGGFFMHSRTGLETEYLGEDWFHLINSCAEYGSKKGMETWLYDEDRWPSGSAGGMVTKEPQYRAMFLEMNQFSSGEWNDFLRTTDTAAVFACRIRDGIFTGKRRLYEGDVPQEEETVLEFRTRYSACNDNYNGFCYVNTMNREAIDKYIESTHEKYRKNCGDRLGTEIQGIFTDEPHRGGVFTNFAEGEENAVPYTPGLFEEFEKRFGYSLSDNLPELFLRRKEKELSKVTRDYFELTQQLFLECFAKPISDWCRENQFIFTGHVLHEDSLCCQAIMQGSLMRFYEYMDYPGMDLLAEGNKCYWIAKQVDSVARQLDKTKVLSELYGCTGWQMNFESYKNIGDWQALFGVNLRCPHLSWYTMKGEGKRDYPASILHQSAWYPEYHYVEDYFSRINAALYGAKADAELLVISPIESVWARAYSGAFEGLTGTDPEIQRLEEQYAAVFHMLTENHIDFDYGEEDIMARHGRTDNGTLLIGSCAYKKVLIAGLDTLRSSTLQLLRDFKAQGGTVIFAGSPPACLDVLPSQDIKRFAPLCTAIPLEEKALVKACANGREIHIEAQDANLIFARSFQSEGERMVMILNTDREKGYNNAAICLGQGKYLEQWDPRTGEIMSPDYRLEDGKIHLTIDLEAGGERLYRIPSRKRVLPKQEVFRETRTFSLPDTFRYILSEPNICVLDMVTVSDTGGLHLPAMEVLKADRALRDHLQLPYRGGEMLQPWYQIKYKGGNSRLCDTITLTYQFRISALPEGISLALEDLEHIRQILINGREISLKSNGKWIDICFDTLAIPDEYLIPGANTITLSMDYYSTCGIESVYLLGTFGVQLQNSGPDLTALPETISIGDITPQGFPFYSGSLTYRLEGLENTPCTVTAADFGGALLKLTGDKEAIIAFPPHRACVPGLYGIQVVLTRRNTFGPLHQTEKYAYAYSPMNFLTEGNDWNPGFTLYEQGLLQKPEILF